MPVRLLHLVCTVALAASPLLVTTPALALIPDPGTNPAGQPGTRSVSRLLMDLQLRYLQSEQADKTYNATTERLKKQQAEVARLDLSLARTRLALQSRRAAVGRLARQQYQSSTELSLYVRLLLARDPQYAIDVGRVIVRLARERAESVQRLARLERQADELARQARKALDEQLTLADRQKTARDAVERQLKDTEELLASLSPEELAALAAFEEAGTVTEQPGATASGTPGDGRPPSVAGDGP
jgi:hypothetical protein